MSSLKFPFYPNVPNAGPMVAPAQQNTECCLQEVQSQSALKDGLSAGDKFAIATAILSQLDSEDRFEKQAPATGKTMQKVEGVLSQPITGNAVPKSRWMSFDA